MTTNQPFKSERHRAIGAASESDHAATARQIARVLGPVPRTRSQSSHWLVRCIRAILRFL